MKTTIALIGDYNEKVTAHRAIPLALKLANAALKTNIVWSWFETKELNANTAHLEQYAAIWVTPGSPYKNMDGVLHAIRFARETGRPFMGTCGGFQHALIEYARNVCGVVDADHAESNPEGTTLVITHLVCSLVGTSSQITFTPGSRLHALFKGQPTIEGYECNYGLNPEWKNKLAAAGVQFSGLNIEGEVRAFELPNHPFFIGTLFQPERSALQNKQHPLITGFVEAIF